MSETAGIVKVDKHVKIVLEHNFQRIGGQLHVDFDLQLHHRGSDFSVFANGGYHYSTFDTDLLAAIINSIMTVRSGISRVDIRAFDLKIYVNQASDVDSIMKQLQYAGNRAGYQVEYIDLSRR